MNDGEQTGLLLKISGDIGEIKGTVKEIKDQHKSYIASNDQRHEKAEERIAKLEDSKKKVIYATLGLSAGGAFAGTKLAGVVNTLLGMFH